MRLNWVLVLAAVTVAIAAGFVVNRSVAARHAGRARPTPVAPVAALAIDPSLATLFAGTSSGVFKSVNGGVSWNLSSTGLTGSVVAIVVDPSNPSTMYVGTSSNGVFKTTNSGSTWTAASAGLTSTSMTALVIDPSATSTLYVATASGVFKTTNGAGNWSASNRGLAKTAVSRLAIDPAHTQTLYAGNANSFGTTAYKSMNGGASWTASSTGLARGPVGALAVDPLNPSRVFAGISAQPDAFPTNVNPPGRALWQTALKSASDAFAAK